MANIKRIITKKVLQNLNGVDLAVLKEYKVSGVGKTKGDGYWSREVRTVPFTLYVPGEYVTAYSEGLYGHASAVFKKKDWNTSKHGLIYTDSKFLKDIRNTLKNAGIKNYNDIDYSTLTQGNDFVDLSVGGKLLAELVNTGKIKVKL